MSVVAAAGVLVTSAGLAYSAYNNANPPKSPAQANAKLESDKKKLATLQQKLSAAQSAGKDTTKIQASITDLNSEIAYLNQYLSGPSSGTPVATPYAPLPKVTAQTTNWPLVIGGGALALGAGVVAFKVLKKRKKK